ncbi:MAG: RluA family pseudouridine synthase [Elusimicrobiota bacterium]|jgi:23S rRNA pseudouridine1911/1915/1917 synthase|nr:RluA family pseudouridine synthase [Elusimicrobiota bacterium]
MQRENKQIFTAPSGAQRLDSFLTDSIDGYTRGIIQNLIKNGGVFVNGKLRKPSWVLAEGDNIEVIWPQAKNTINLKGLIIFENKDFFVINKPAGLLVHPQSPAWENEHSIAFAGDETLISAVLANPPKNFDVNAPRAGLVHRLDRETSGVMLMAKNQKFQEAMQNLFTARKVNKTYDAICCGQIPDDTGTINVPIGRLSGGKIKASDLGREAITDYKVLKRKSGFSYAELYPRTGRTNQLRVHMSWLGYPVLGDWLYKGATAPRLMLHAKKLEFKHPFTNKPLKFEIQPPADFAKAWKKHTEKSVGG